MNNPHPPITVIKRNLAGEETWRYTGRLLSHKDNKIILEARFNLPDTNVHEIILKQGDRFIETFYTDRWYNIFEIHDLYSDEIKGWYYLISILPWICLFFQVVVSWYWTKMNSNNSL